jgi:hypothetical protein
VLRTARHPKNSVTSSPQGFNISPMPGRPIRTGPETGRAGGVVEAAGIEPVTTLP